MEFFQSSGVDSTFTQGFYDDERIPEPPRPKPTPVPQVVPEKSSFRKTLPPLIIGVLLGVGLTLLATRAKKLAVPLPLTAQWDPYNASMISHDKPEDIQRLIELAKGARENVEMNYRVNTDIGWIKIEPLFTKQQLPELLIKQYIKLLVKNKKAKLDTSKVHEEYPKKKEEKEETDAMGKPKPKKIKEETPEEALHKKLMDKGRQKLTDLEALELRVHEKWSGEVKYYPVYNRTTNRWSLGIVEFDKNLRSVKLRIFSTSGQETNISRELKILSRLYQRELDQDIEQLRKEFLELPTEGKKLDIMNRLINLKEITHPEKIPEPESVKVPPSESGVYVCLMARAFLSGKPFGIRKSLFGQERLLIAGDIMDHEAPDDLIEIFNVNNIKIFK